MFILTAINVIITAIGVIVIPLLIGRGKIRPGISPIESLKSGIILEMHKSRSQGKIYCHICKIRDTVFEKKRSRKDRSPSLKYLLQFDQALAELDMEKRILMVYTSDIEMVEYGKSTEKKKKTESYQSPYSDIISQYGIIEDSYLRYAIIPTYDLCERILEKRGRLRNVFFR